MSAQPLDFTPAPAPCPACGSRDEGHETARCAYTATARDDVRRRAADLGIPDLAATDLFAHLRTIGDDVEWARRHAITVMDLGWRPVVGFGAQPAPPQEGP